MSKYIVEKDIQESPCEHPLCDRLHKRFMQRGFNDVWFHETKSVWWLVIDSETGDQVHNAEGKKECVQHAKWLNSKIKVQKEDL